MRGWPSSPGAAGLAGEPTYDDIAQGDSINVRHYHEIISAGRADLVRPQQRRSRESEAALGLATELGQAVRLVRQRRLQDLDRHEVQEPVALERLPHDTLCAPPQQLQQPIGAELGPGDERCPGPRWPRRRDPAMALGLQRRSTGDSRGGRLSPEHPRVEPARGRVHDGSRPPCEGAFFGAGTRFRVRGDDHRDRFRTRGVRDLTLARQELGYAPMPRPEPGKADPRRDRAGLAPRVWAIGPESIRSLKPMPGSSPRWRFLADRCRESTTRSRSLRSPIG